MRWFCRILLCCDDSSSSDSSSFDCLTYPESDYEQDDESDRESDNISYTPIPSSPATMPLSISSPVSSLELTESSDLLHRRNVYPIETTSKKRFTRLRKLKHKIISMIRLQNLETRSVSGQSSSVESEPDLHSHGGTNSCEANDSQFIIYDSEESTRNLATDFEEACGSCGNADAGQRISSSHYKVSYQANNKSAGIKNDLQNFPKQFISFSNNLIDNDYIKSSTQRPVNPGTIVVESSCSELPVLAPTNPERISTAANFKTAESKILRTEPTFFEPADLTANDHKSENIFLESSETRDFYHTIPSEFESNEFKDNGSNSKLKKTESVNIGPQIPNLVNSKQARAELTQLLSISDDSSESADRKVVTPVPRNFESGDYPNSRLSKVDPLITKYFCSDAEPVHIKPNHSDCNDSICAYPATAVSEVPDLTSIRYHSFENGLPVFDLLKWEEIKAPRSDFFGQESADVERILIPFGESRISGSQITNSRIANSLDNNSTAVNAESIDCNFDNFRNWKSGLRNGVDFHTSARYNTKIDDGIICLDDQQNNGEAVKADFKKFQLEGISLPEGEIQTEEITVCPHRREYRSQSFTELRDFEPMEPLTKQISTPSEILDRDHAYLSNVEEYEKIMKAVGEILAEPADQQLHVCWKDLLDIPAGSTMNEIAYQYLKALNLDSVRAIRVTVYNEEPDSGSVTYQDKFVRVVSLATGGTMDLSSNSIDLTKIMTGLDQIDQCDRADSISPLLLNTVEKIGKKIEIIIPYQLSWQKRIPAKRSIVKKSILADVTNEMMSSSLMSSEDGSERSGVRTTNHNAEDGQIDFKTGVFIIGCVFTD
ncbi:uncharacterized protein V1516DRAFT_662681 [Lipomyces oligophaga]|uniref:uncharacterized protein n=1 Tax=Lipomyces oligophaga TaxID=45792 RepID=UPI0034CDA90C